MAMLARILPKSEEGAKSLAVPTAAACRPGDPVGRRPANTRLFRSSLRPVSARPPQGLAPHAETVSRSSGRRAAESGRRPSVRRQCPLDCHGSLAVYPVALPLVALSRVIFRK